MKDFSYVKGVATLCLDRLKCVGCGICLNVCPHGVFVLEENKAEIAMGDHCIECGACANNCPVGAISVTPGTGCAAMIIEGWIKGKKVTGSSCC